MSNKSPMKQIFGQHMVRLEIIFDDAVLIKPTSDHHFRSIEDPINALCRGLCNLPFPKGLVKQVLLQWDMASDVKVQELSSGGASDKKRVNRRKRSNKNIRFQQELLQLAGEVENVETALATKADKTDMDKLLFTEADKVDVVARTSRVETMDIITSLDTNKAVHQITATMKENRKE